MNAFLAQPAILNLHLSDIDLVRLDRLPGELAGQVVARLVRGERARTAAQLFDLLGAAFQFPYHYGNGGWAQLTDCATDLGLSEGLSHALLISEAVHLLADEAPAQLRVFADVVAELHRRWSEGDLLGPPRAFHVVLQGQPGELIALQQRLRDQAIAFDERAL